VQDAVQRRLVQPELAAVPDTLDHAERDRSDDEYENQAHVLVPPLVGRKLAERAGNRKGRRGVNWRNPKEQIAAPLGFLGFNAKS
jgi:hypothetical protein